MRDVKSNHTLTTFLDQEPRPGWPTLSGEIEGKNIVSHYREKKFAQHLNFFIYFPRTMAVAQLVSLFETLHQETSIKSTSRTLRSHNQMSSSKVRLHLQTIFSHNPLHRSSKTPSMSNMTSPTSSSPSIRSSPSSTFGSFGRSRAPPNDLDSAILSPVVSPLSSHPPQPYHIRRQPSAIDLALQEEILYADDVEAIGLGLLEPRPRANTASSTTSSVHCSIMEFMSESVVTPPVLDSIFDVMERA